MANEYSPSRMRVLVIDDDRSIRRTLEKFFSGIGYEVATAEDGQSGVEAVLAGGVDVVLLDLGMPVMDGLEVLNKLHGHENLPPIIVVTARDDMKSTIAAIQRGAYDYMVKPLDIERLKMTVRRALESRELSARLDMLVETMSRDFQVDNIVGRTSAMRDVFKTIGMVSTSLATVLITGESGTGKELVARAIHYSSEGRDQPFVAVNCTAFPRDLLESELFGHARGAFTGAIADKLGRFQLAGGGTLFLDEIGELPVDLQAKLLRVVQERTFERVGDPKPVALRARIITATHRDLSAMVAAGSFREDLYYRLRVVEVRLPPLRERRDDIPPLVDHLLQKITRDLHKKIRYVARDAMELLTRYAWPGNVRELENALTRAVVLTKGEVLEASTLPIAVDEEDDAQDVAVDEGAGDLAKTYPTLREVERKHIAAVLSASGWNKRRTCAVLGITRPTLDRKIKEYQLDRTQGAAALRPGETR